MKRSLLACLGMALFGGMVFAATPAGAAEQPGFAGFVGPSQPGTKDASVFDRYKAMFPDTGTATIAEPPPPLGAPRPASGVVDARPITPGAYMILRERRAVPAAAVPRPS